MAEKKVNQKSRQKKTEKQTADCRETVQKNEDLTDLKDILEERVKTLEQESRAIKEKMMRNQADFENSRRRLLRDKEEAVRYANASLITDLLPILDDLERAISAVPADNDADSLRSGVVIIERQLQNMLENNYGLKRFTGQGQLFDPGRFEAIAMEESDEHDEQTIVEDYQKGYMIHDRVLRPARVKVANPTLKSQADKS